MTQGHVVNADAHVKTVTKNENQWPIQAQLVLVDKQVGRWQVQQRELQGFALASESSESAISLLELHRDERTDYRFNLSSSDPRLFVVLENHDDTQLTPLVVTASQTVAGSYLDGDYTVLSAPMPLPVQAWMEAFIGRHGELLEMRGKKRKKGAGRSSEQ
ncbi:DUF3305 domain-containing protein [Vibrio hippocampi]|uniref:DUF3305 domain-containing protein n=1 Tax=Vibrio hippocampi TaxID=654686 RepID=A0ABN8DFE1_9VIBR|nr:DUF3305 domain-containing protein [Vibrio hippocampi]CAH0525960.1 hypothetical protein VHP8226_01442 [Vibrio hippocampi]